MSELFKEKISNNAKIGYTIGAILLVVIGGSIFWGSMTGGVQLDSRLCPVKGGPTKTTVLILDTSDPLSAKHISELRRLIREIKGNASDSRLEIRKGEMLVVYTVSLSGTLEKPIVEVCNPGKNPDEWTLKDEFTQGKVFALHNWQRFEEHIESLFPVTEGAEQPQSPILETLTIVVPRYAPSQREKNDANNRLRLIIFSDLLQNSPGLSHYGPYPDIEGMKRGKRELLTDLSEVDVTLFRLENDRYAKWQTVEHYYWWTHVIQSMGGRIQWQQSL